MERLFQLRLSREETGATMLEYALIAACIAVVALSTVGLMGDEVKATFETTHNALAGTNFPNETLLSR